MKKIFYLILVMTLLVGCKNSKTNLKVASSNYILYDWLSVISEGTNLNIKILDEDSNLEDYDFAVYSGDGSDDWFVDKVKNKDNIISLNNLKNESHGDCCPHNNSCCESHGNCCENHSECCENHKDCCEMNNYMKSYINWSSIDFAKKMCSKICDYLVNIDNGNEKIYKKNLEIYNSKLDDLDKRLKDVFDKYNHEEAVAVSFIEDVNSKDIKKSYIDLMNEYISEVDSLLK